MDSTLGTKLKRTAEEVADRLNDAAHQAGERIAEMRELQRIDAQIRRLRRERDCCRLAMADLLIRMFDQNTFAEALLRPEYERIKELDIANAALIEERERVGTAHVVAPAPAEETVEAMDAAQVVEGAAGTPETAPAWDMDGLMPGEGPEEE